MIKNYLKVALRSLLRHKVYTVINITGLAVGITSCFLIYFFVKSEFSYDRFHSKADRIYRAWQYEKYQEHEFVNTVTPIPMAEAIQRSFPEVESTCRVNYFNAQASVGNRSFEENINMVDSGFFNLFDFALTKGDIRNPFPTSNSVILTPAASVKLFGTQSDPVGKSLNIQLGDNIIPFTVSGIAEPAPEESSIQYDVLIPYSNAKHMFRERAFRSWTNVFNETYVLLKPGTGAAGLEKKFPLMVREALGQDYHEGSFLVHLQPITDIHLNNSLPAGNLPVSSPKYSYILLTIGILILLLACVNFVTLSIGRSAGRAMEVGVRKVLGARRGQLLKQFWGEALLITGVAVIAGGLIAFALRAPFNLLAQKHLRIQLDWELALFALLLTVVVALVSGIYPALILSGFNPVEVLKNRLRLAMDRGLMRQGLITGQFVVAISLTTCTLMISRQMNFLMHKDLGYRKEQVVVVSTNKKMKDGFELAALYRTELLRHPEVESVAVSIFSFSETPWANLGYTDDRKVYRTFQFNVIDPNFINTMGIRILQGRNFLPGNSADRTGSILVNESLAREYGWDNPVGRKLPGHYEERIIGVMQDFNFASLHSKVRPLVLALMPDSIIRHSEDFSIQNAMEPRVSIRMRAGSPAGNLDVLKTSWAKVAPAQDFDFRFLDESLTRQYRQDQRTGTMVKIASGLSIFIACMGLFGLATLTVVRRTREIGIRKVLGASAGSLVALLARNFVLLVLLAALISFPLAWWAVHEWLSDFAYRTSISWWVFLLAAILAMAVALLTVSIQSIRAAMTKPVKTLRTE
jgi:putative ABC transport system permease protein